MLAIRHNPFVKKAIVGAGKLAQAVSKPGPGIILLIYHSIAEQGSIVSVPACKFEEQIKWLADNYPIISLDRALSLRSVKEDVVVLSFDDGYKDYLTTAYPILQRYDAPSIVYVVTNLVQYPEERYQIQAGSGKTSLNLRDLEQLAREELVTIGSHTHTHQRLTALSDEQLRSELEISYHILRDVLGSDRIHFSYPWAIFDERTTRMVREYYETAVIGKGRKNQLPIEAYQLMRIPIVNEPLDFFKERVKGNFLIEAKVREHLIGS